MQVAQVLSMAGGVGRTSYASNSSLQMKAIAKAKPLVEQTISDLYSSTLPKRMAVADLGCSSGPNAFAVAGEITDTIIESSNQHGRVPPEMQYFLNDLPGNDFNTLFWYAASFQEKLKQADEDGKSTTVPLYISGVAGSFYTRLFPDDSIHFVHSSYCLHFLSQVPPGLKNEAGHPLNKQNIYLSKTSPPIVCQSYVEQFRKDFTSFLKLRSQEIVHGGCMVLVFLGRGNADPLNGECSHLWKLLADALTCMASEGFIDKAKVDSFNLPFYAPSLEELRAVILDEASFGIIKCEAFELNWDPTDDLLEDYVAKKSTTGENVAECIRAVTESMLADHFGEEIDLDDLFSRYAQNVATHLSNHKTKYFNLGISLKKESATVRTY
ncbi:hypothetical protein Taro_035556 [Colocasia esculenta]|uniref:Uncharacterized protein n=1 Tax=Colocasia esculenta TaxID=4460 RepID=A0A843WF83_COLES|nr:hypothetical protein [Colocasia esculenta]